MEFTPKLLLEKPHFLGIALGYKDLTDLHSEWIKYIWFTKENRTLQAHRGAYKTTAVTVVGSIIYLLFNPNNRLLICRKEASGASAIIKEISKHLEGKVISAITKRMYNKSSYLVVNRASPLPAITWNIRNIVKKEESIMGMGIKSPITSYHFDFIITDDIVTLKDRTSPAERKSTENFFIELKNVADPGARTCNVGTPWHKNDCFTLMPKAKKFPIGTTNLVKFTKEHIQSLREEMPPTIFSINYDLKHTASENLLFENPTYGDLPAKWSPLGHIDKGFSGKDSTVLTMIGDYQGQLYGIGFLWSENVLKLSKRIANKSKDYSCGTVYNETNDDKGATKVNFTDEGMVIKQYHESMNKHVKINNYLYKFWKKIIWSHDTDPEYMAQITEYEEKADHDDAPDSAASLLREGKFGIKSALDFYSK